MPFLQIVTQFCNCVISDIYWCVNASVCPCTELFLWSIIHHCAGRRQSTTKPLADITLSDKCLVMMIHNCHTCMGRPPLVMPFFFFFFWQKMINSDFHKGWLRDNKAHLPQWWMDVSSVTGSLSEELSVRQIFKHVEKCARRSYRTLRICFSLSSEQTRLSTPSFGFSVFIFSLSTAPRPWPLRHSASVFKNLQSSRLWGCLHMNSRGSGFTKRTIFGEGRLSRQIIFYQ